MSIKKRRIRETVWGNWYGYEGVKKVIFFHRSEVESEREMAERWLKNGWDVWFEKLRVQ